jgi:predicted lipopolysaccharide heptosyltransferase III
MDPSQILPNLPANAKILFIRLRSLGDTLLSTPLYAALKEWRPDLRISVLVEKPNDEVLMHNPDIRDVLAIPAAAERAFSPSHLAVRFTAIRRLRAEHFDCCFNLHGGSTSALFTWLSRATYRVGLKNFRNSYCYNVRIELQPANSIKGKRHTVEYQMEWLHFLGMPKAEIPKLRVFPDPVIGAHVEAKLIRQGICPGTPYCVIQPTSKFGTKEWTPRGFAEISDHLQKFYGYRTVLTGGPGEGAKLKQVIGHCQLEPAVLGQISVAELMGVIRGANLFIGNDSGPTHLAAALGIPTVVLYGSSDSQVWYPWKAQHQLVQNPFGCNPCPGYRCLVYDEPKCILSISPSQIKTAIERLLVAYK